MTELGKLLQQTRKKKKYSLEEVHKLTKISQKYIKALEESDPSVFPAELYRRSFLKNYAKFLGLNVDEVVKMYEQEKTGVQYDLFSNEEILQQTIDKTKKVDIEEIKEAKHNKIEKIAEKKASVETATIKNETEKENKQPEIVIAENKEVENKQELNDKPKTEIKEETKVKTVKRRGRKKQSVKVETKTESETEIKAETKEEIKETAVINDIKEDVITQNNVEEKEITKEKIIPEVKKENKQEDNSVSEVKQEVKEENKQEDKPFLFNIKLVLVIIVCILFVFLLIKCFVDKNTDVQPKEEVVSDVVVEEQEEQKPESLKQTVTIDAISDTWIRVIADDVKIFEGFLYTGQQQTCYANEMFNIRVGNADGLKVTFNDKPVDVISLAKEDGTATLILKKDTEI